MPNKAELEEAMAYVLQEHYGMTWRSHLDTVKDLFTLLGADETKHKIKVDGNDYTIEHPIIERLDGSLFDCDFNETVKWWPSQLDEGYWWACKDKTVAYGVFFEKIEEG